MFGGPEFYLDPATTQPTAPTAPKRSVEETQQHVGPGSLSQAQQDNNASDSAASSEPRPRPVFKMRRTGHSGPFPFSGRPIVTVPPDGNHATPTPSVPSLWSPAPHAQASRDARQPSSLVPDVQKEKERKPVDQSSASTGPSEHPTVPGENQNTQSTQPQSNPVIGLDEKRSTHDSSRPDIGLPITGDIKSMSGAPMPLYTLDRTGTPKPIMPPDVQKVFDSALDDGPYKTWIDESGNKLPTAGALLPVGYKLSNDPVFPWVCPVRSCRKLLPGLMGLGKHFCNSHRATCFNDNGDGTLTDLGTYANPETGNGRRSGGFAKPPVIVSKKVMSLVEAPMVSPTLHYGANPTPKPTIPQRGGPRRFSLSVPKPVSVDSDSTSTDGDESASPSKASAPGESRQLDMANPDRPYHMWRDGSGTLIPLKNVLIPDGYKHDTTISDRPWICPVRSCRRLFKAPVDFGNHFKGHHRGSRLNDNLDGTFSVVEKKDSTALAVVVSRGPMDIEPIAEPLRPVYPRGMASKSILWVKATKSDPNPKPIRKRSGVDPEIIDVDADVALKLATDDRSYHEWWDESGQLVSMAGALIPEGYELDDTFPGRPWVCPVRSCRLACKIRRNLGYHFMTTHKTCSLNDNGDGTFSIIGLHNITAPRVVSKEPLDPNEPPLQPPRLPPYVLESHMAGRQKKDSLTAPRTASPSTNKDASSDLFGARLEGAAGRLWDHIRSHVPKLSLSDGKTPEMVMLLRLPKVRDLNIIPGTLPSDLNGKQITAFAIQVVGEQNPRACSECRRQDGPFDCCVSLSEDAAQRLYQWLATSSRACAGCIARKNSSACSLRKLGSAWERSSRQSLRAGVDEGAVDAGWGNDLAGRRRSTRLFLANGDVDEDGADEESDGEPHPPEPAPRPTRLVTLKLARSAANGRTAGEPHVAAWEGNGTTEKVLHMEDWEMDEGRVNTAGEALAFSSTYLTANQTVQVSQNINFQAITVTSGQVHQFPADATKTRMCTLANGKLRVKVGRDEFVVGSQGIFKITPGKVCTVTNRCYMDLVLHVTSLRGGA